MGIRTGQQRIMPHGGIDIIASRSTGAQNQMDSVIENSTRDGKRKKDKSANRVAFPIAKKTIDNIIYPVQTKRGLKWGKRKDHNQTVGEGQHTQLKNQMGKLLDGFLILYSCRVRLPHEAIKSKLSSQQIVDVIEEDLCYFQNLTALDLSDNHVRFEQLRNLRYLSDLNLQFNHIVRIPALNNEDFTNLEVLNLSYNRISVESIRNLFICKQIKNLDLSANSLEMLPADLPCLTQLEELNLSSNLLTSVSSVQPPATVFKILG